MSSDLDAMLNDAANTFLDASKSNAAAPAPAAAPAATPANQTPAEIKPWLASSANVPKEFRDKWNTYVKLDRQASPATPFQPSHSYRSWDSQPLNYSKLVHDLVKKSCAQAGFDEAKTQKLLSQFHPVIETEFSRQVQHAYAQQILNDVKKNIAKDPNYEAERFPHLTELISK